MARYAPGVSLGELERMTPEETRLVRKTVERHVDEERALALEHTKAIVRAAGRGLRIA